MATGRGDFCRVVPRKGQRLKELETFLSVIRARHRSFQVISANEEALRHVLSSACEQTHIEYSNTRIETPPANGRGENNVRFMKEVIQCQKESVNAVGIKCSIMHPFFALLARHSEWLLNHLPRSDFPGGSWSSRGQDITIRNPTGNPAPRSTELLERILVQRREDDDKQPRFQLTLLLGVIAGDGEVIALRPDGSLAPPRSALRCVPTSARELQVALTQMSAIDWRTPGCKKRENTQYHKGSAFMSSGSSRGFRDTHKEERHLS